MNIAIVGCGFVADFYAVTLRNYPALTVTGVFDTDHDRKTRFSQHYRFPEFSTMQELLDSEDVDIILNLTNPRSHFSVSKACLLAGKHVYSEKPLSTDLVEAEELVAIARQRKLVLSGAPCSILSESAQTLWRSLREGNIGDVRLVYAELDDGMVHRMRYKKWLSESGTPWPYVDEFEVGCTLEHAGYYVTWLVAMFGSVKTVTSFAACVIPDKKTDAPIENPGNDFSVACLEFESGIVARLTCSIVAPHDHGITVFGEDGILNVNECWDYSSPVKLKKLTKLSLWAEKYPLLTSLFRLGFRKIPTLKSPTPGHRYRGTTNMDFARGVAEMADSILEGRECRLSADFCLHVNEIVLAIEKPEGPGRFHKVKSQTGNMAAEDWAS